MAQPGWLAVWLADRMKGGNATGQSEHRDSAEKLKI